MNRMKNHNENQSLNLKITLCNRKQNFDIIIIISANGKDF